MLSVQEIGKRARQAAYPLANASTAIKNQALDAMADALESNKDRILSANTNDINDAKARGIGTAMLDRLSLNDKRIAQMADGLRMVRDLSDPVGEVVSMWKRPNGLLIGQQRVPLGVIGIIYEARPNVTADAVGLCLKTGNAVILRGGSEAINSNKAIVDILAKAATQVGIPENSIQLIEDTDRQSAVDMMKLHGYIDVLIPRGGAGLIRTVVENATVPTIETGVGNCHVYVDGDADINMATDIIVNAKTSRPAVCNAAETLLVDKAIAEAFLPVALPALEQKNVELRGCKVTCSIYPSCKAATEEDWATEYLDYILAVKVVDGIDQAIEHVNKYGTKHSEAIVTNDYQHAQRFLQEVDAAAVYVNASTRFTDGGEFGFGAEIGISTQKLHARGPMGLKELTTIKYIIYGNGQIRA
ncbi:glutamate-5-semialdehyde dehydrogenase [Mahella australiensis 50-1 BON]|uniref:Gamma-glutamyl phosphate reductase n=1 Tax=Mahella australiensis (strain DSM 15567 / CIP 107919 / 50-1 BON) TaxID=697281 RepID=F3ZXV2_MAHA5|nr:glutamate-5-semialdehyde dehydrogenase [Mahella australiensis]AEE96622.1 glutamate-5-semialdehyde dehydrogenase [Mahella australiensis 50-1 BON]